LEEQKEDATFKYNKRKADEQEAADDKSSSDGDDDDELDELAALEGLEGGAAADVWADFHPEVNERHNLARDRKVRKDNRGVGDKKRNASNKSEPVNVEIETPLTQNPNESFKAVRGKLGGQVLFCEACSKELSRKKSTIKNHIQGASHVASLARFNREAQRGISKFMHDYVVNKHATIDAAGGGRTTTQTLDEFRLRVCHAFLIDGVRFECLEKRQPGGLRMLLEELGSLGTLPGRDLRDQIPAVMEIENNRTKAELAVVDALSIVFDGTPSVAEVFSAAGRFVKNGKVTHRCLTFKFYEDSFNKETLGAAIVELLLRDYNVPRNKVKFKICDGAAVNRAAMNAMTPMFPNSEGITCVSHRANVTGKKLLATADLVAAFEKPWSYMTKNSLAARKLFKEESGESAEGFSDIRWYCWLEIVSQVQRQWDAVVAVVNSDDDFFPESREKLKEMMTADQVDALRRELAVVVDLGKGLVQLCYKTEGDAAMLCTTVYDHWKSVEDMLREVCDAATPVLRLRALLPSLAALVPVATDAQVQALAQLAKPMYDKMVLDQNVNAPRGGKMASTLRILRAARLFDCNFISRTPLQALQGIAGEIAQVSAIGICSVNLARLETELQLYKAQCDVAVAIAPGAQIDSWDFFLAQTIRLPTWSLCAKEVALIAPSSATVERIFSLFTQGFNDNQDAALEDYKGTAVKLKYNRIWRLKDD
jgi:hypothetical protein